MEDCTAEKCGFYGECVNNTCECFFRFRGDNCDTFIPIHDHPQIFVLFRTFYSIVFGSLLLLATLQVAFRIRIGAFKLVGRNASLSLFILWGIVALLDAAQEPYYYTRLSDKSKIAFKVWLELAQQDFLVASCLLVTLAWFDVVRFVVARFGEAERTFVKWIKPCVVAVVVILFLVEAGTVASIDLMDTMIVYDNYINLYRAVLGVDVLILSSFFAFYGLRILSYLKQTMSKDISQRTFRVTRLIMIFGFVSFATLALLVSYNVIQTQLAPSMWYVYIALSKTNMLLAAVGQLSIIRDEITNHAYKIKYWIDPTLIVTITSVREIGSNIESGSAASSEYNSAYSSANS